MVFIPQILFVLLTGYAIYLFYSKVKEISCCTEFYLVIGPLSSKNKPENVAKYISTRLFRFLVLLIKNAQNAIKKVYSFAPMQDFSKLWADEKLYVKYDLTKEKIAFIERMIRRMDVSEKNESNG